MTWPFLTGGTSTATALEPLKIDRWIFTAGGKPKRWKGVTAFGLLTRFEKGEDIDPFLNACKGFIVLRVFYYWETINAALPADDVLHRFLDYVAAWGFHVELVLFTGPPRPDAQQIVDHVFVEFARHTNLLIELVNEPGVHAKVDPATLKVPQTSILWTDGLTTAGHRGFYLTPHTQRDPEWARRSHDLLEYKTGGGPASPSDPAWNQAATADEPAKLEDVPSATWDIDFRAYFGGCSLMGAGATFHFESGKHGEVPTDQERHLLAIALDAMDAFPDDAPLGPYRRIDEQGKSLRTYVVGPYMVRVRPTTLQAPEPGWTAIDADGILWRK